MEIHTCGLSAQEVRELKVSGHYILHTEFKATGQYESPSQERKERERERMKKRRGEEGGKKEKRELRLSVTLESTLSLEGFVLPRGSGNGGSGAAPRPHPYLFLAALSSQHLFSGYF